MDGTPRLVNIDAAAARLALSPWTLRRHIALGTITVTRVGRRVLIRDEEIERIRANGLPGLGATMKAVSGSSVTKSPSVGSSNA